MLKLSVKTLRDYHKLSSEHKNAVDQIIREHIAACRKQGIAFEDGEKVLIEAMEQVRLEGVGTPPSGESASHEPRRCYGVYIPPRNLD